MATKVPSISDVVLIFDVTLELDSAYLSGLPTGDEVKEVEFHHLGVGLRMIDFFTYDSEVPTDANQDHIEYSLSTYGQ